MLVVLVIRRNKYVRTYSLHFNTEVINFECCVIRSMQITSTKCFTMEDKQRRHS
jgi:hypothetical protein